MFRNSKLNMILSLVMAVILWLYVTGQVDPRTDRKLSDLEIEFTNLHELRDSGLDFAGSGDETANIVLEGKRAVLNKVSEEDIHITADLSKCSEGKNTVTLKARTPKGIDVDRISPQTITVNIEERISKEKPVKIKYEGKMPKGREPGDFTLQYDHVTVWGAESKVEDVAFVQVALDLSKINDKYVTLESKATAVNEKGKPVKDVTLSASTVEVTTAMKYVKEVPLTVETTEKTEGGKKPEKIEKPTTVVIKGSKDAVDSITKLSTETVDISGVKKTETIPIKVILPYGTELADESEDISLKVIMED